MFDSDATVLGKREGLLVATSSVIESLSIVSTTSKPGATFRASSKLSEASVPTTEAASVSALLASVSDRDTDIVMDTSQITESRLRRAR